jgi:hypothetical protein
MFIQDCLSTSITSSTIRHNSATEETAGISVVTSNNYKEELGATVHNCTFFNNTSTGKTALRIKAPKADVVDCLFELNTAKTDGGALHLSCAGNCEYSVVGNSFLNNSALNGGGLMWLHQPKVELNNVYKHNSAVYGPDFASFAVKVAEQASATSKASSETVTYYGIASGQRMPKPIVAVLLDHYGQVVASDNSSIGQLQATDTTKTTILGDFRVTAEQGMYNFTNLYVSSSPGTDVRVKVDSSVLDTEEPYSVLLSMRQCIAGEVLVGTECQTCSYGTYSFDPLVQCRDCPSGAECFGGSLMVPLQGYWRSSRTSDNLIECPNPSACRGSPNIVPAITGICSRGYKGNLCQACDKSFSRTSENVCAACPERSANVMRLIGILAALVAVCALFVRSSLAAVYKPQTLTSIYYKIFANYLQLILLSSQLNLDWPDTAKEYFTYQNFAADVDRQLFSIDCYFEEDSQQSVDEIYYNKVIALAFIPVLLPTAAALYWSVVYYFKRQKRVFRLHLVTTIVVLFFLVLPSLIKQYFTVYNCMEIEGQLWLASNLDIKCFSKTHTFIAIAVAFPAILVWGLGAPAFVLGYLVRNRRRLELFRMKVRFGLLYNGFRPTHFYWEFLILYRKTLITFLVVFAGNQPIQAQALSMTIVLITTLFLQFWGKPYTTTSLNKLELASNLAVLLTMYCGLYFLTKDLSEVAKVLLFCSMLGVNFYFFSYFVSYFGYSIIAVLAERFHFLRILLRKKESFPEVSIADNPVSSHSYVRGNDTRRVFSLVQSYVPKLTNYHESQLVLEYDILNSTEFLVSQSAQADKPLARTFVSDSFEN